MHSAHHLVFRVDEALVHHPEDLLLRFVGDLGLRGERLPPDVVLLALESGMQALENFFLCTPFDH